MRIAPSDRDEAILSLAKRVDIEASLLARRMPFPAAVRAQMYREFMQAGWVGAVQAVGAFDPAKGGLQTYGVRRIRGAMLDYLRSQDMLPASARKNWKSEGRKIRLVSLDDVLFDPSPRATRAMERICIRADVHRLLCKTRMDPRWKRALFERYWRDRELAEIGLDMGVNFSRVCQLCTAAIEKMREVAGCASC